MANGYFQLIHNETGTHLKIIKPTDAGTPVSINEVMEYLNTQVIPYDLSVLNQGIVVAAQSGESEVIIPVNPLFCRPVRETYNMFITPDKMQVSVRFYAPSMGAERMTSTELIKDLAFKYIKYGIKQDVIEDFFNNPRYCTNIVIAEGIPPVHGKDAQIEYLFNTDLKAHPTLNEDGTVDFFKLNTINHCLKGDLLAKLTPENTGEYGYNVYNERLKPREVKRLLLHHGNNISLSQDRLNMFSEVNGHVMLVEDKVFVSNVLTVENVNNVTGNIEFEGSVRISGNVFTNFSVKAKGNIEVNGVVEGAYLESGGDIIISRGMNGRGKGTLKAEGNIIAKYLENAKAEAGGYVSTDSILHCEILAGTEVIVTSKKGFIAGGKICAARLVEVKILGSSMGIDTIVEVGVDPEMKQRIQKLRKQIVEHSKEIKAAQPILNAMAQKIAQGVRLSSEQIKYVQNLTIENKNKSIELEAYMKELDELQKVFDMSAGAQVVVTGEVFAGTQIIIGDFSMVVKSDMKYCRFVKSQGEVKMTAI